MYSSALRVGEILNLRLKDIDSKNNRITIKNGKGKIDRVVMLDDGILEMLRVYWSEYHTKEGGTYSAKSIQCIVKKSAIKNGTDLRTVQKIAGHKNINTTANYIKLVDSDILNTISLFKQLN